MRIIHALNNAVKQIDQTAITVLSVVTVSGYQWFIKKMSLIADFDIVGLHYYPAVATLITEGFEDDFCDLVTKAKSASGGKPVIFLETGFKSDGGEGHTPETQQLFLRNIAEYVQQAGAVGFFWYEYLDNPNEPHDRQRYSGLLEEDRSPKTWLV